MERIFELIQGDKLRRIVEGFSEAFHLPVVLLGEKREVLMECPGGALQSELSTEPLTIRDSIIGYIGVPQGEETAENVGRLIARNLSEVVEMGYEIESLSGEVARNYEELSLLWRLSSRFGAALSIETICDALVDEVMSLCPARNVSVLLSGVVSSGSMTASHSGNERGMEPQLPLLFPKVSSGADAAGAVTMTLDAGEGLVRHVFEEREPLTVCDVSKDERFEGLPYPVKSLLIVPLIVEESVIGVVIANDKLDGEEFFSTEIKLISSIASQAATSIKKALLLEELHTMFFSTAEALSFAIDAKDPYTYGHSKRVSEIAGNIAKKAGLSPDVVSWIRLAALLHDIGKIGTPENILCKDGDLSDDETVRIKEHPHLGATMLEHIESMKEIARWVRYHHERYDGSGYPSGLKGDIIPLPSRIIAIADYYDAMTTDRPYRMALSSEEALRRMKESVGTHFEPALVDLFEKVITESE